MNSETALACLSALAQENRLGTVRLLVRAGDEGLAAGDIAQHLGIASSLSSAHLNKLEQSGMITSQRVGRSIIYRANYNTLRDLIAFLMEDCCGGIPAIVGSLRSSVLTSGENS